jgi:hypothetical protein
MILFFRKKKKTENSIVVPDHWTPYFLANPIEFCSNGRILLKIYTSKYQYGTYVHN